MAEKTQKQKVGGLGEDEAVQYLINKGYRIIERNHRQKWGEIDIVTISPTGVLVFVEVKAMGKNDFFKPEDNLTHSKLRKLQRTCQLYVGHRADLVREVGWQIDLVAVDFLGDNCNFRHYENI